MTLVEPVAAERREAVINGERVELYVDPIALAALDAAQCQSAIYGGSPASWGELPTAEELPLRLVLLEHRVERLEGHCGYGTTGRGDGHFTNGRTRHQTGRGRG